MKLKNRIWVWKKRREINKQLKAIDFQLAIFKMRRNTFEGRDGTGDINMMRMYRLKGNGGVTMGSSVYTLDKLQKSLYKAIEVLDKFEIKERKR